MNILIFVLSMTGLAALTMLVFLTILFTLDNGKVTKDIEKLTVARDALIQSFVAALRMEEACRALGRLIPPTPKGYGTFNDYLKAIGLIQ